MIEQLLEFFIFLLQKYQNRDSLKTLGAARSSQWPKTKQEFEKLNPKICAVCGNKVSVQCHHQLPFHNHPELENDLNNLIWLCEDKNCHIRFGHLFSYQSWNENIKEDAKIWREKIENRP